MSSDPIAAHAELLHALGATVHALPVGTAGLPECGRLGALPCWSIAAPPRDAIAVARRLARRGEVGLLLADDPATQRRTVVVSIDPIRPAVLDRRIRTPLPLVRLRRAVLPASRLGAALAAATALDVDAAGRRAFGVLRTAIAAVIDRLDGRIRRETRHAWTLLQVTRLLFLRFVESEGWLDGRPDFLRRAIDDVLAAGRHPGRHLLAPLFFGLLNCPPERRSRRLRALGTVPFLNGGLFEPHPLEHRHHWRLDRDGWLQLFELVIDRIEVTLSHDLHADRVTPELLGRVFEGVMDPVERRDGGAFYTPAPLVDAIVREAYARHLAPRLARSPMHVLAQLDDPDPALAEALLGVRVLDPAVGSGAFLVGALQVARGPRETDLARTRRLVTRNLFGVDRNPAAVRITELRLWLEILRAMRGAPADRLVPLPNLDGNVRVGDAVIDPLAGLRVAPAMVDRLARARADSTEAHGRARRHAVTRLRTLEGEAAIEALIRAEGRLERAIAELLEHASAPQLFGEVRGLGAGSRHQLTALRRALHALRGERRRIQRDPVSPRFALESAFAGELADGGFDLVVGNPPWVRAERLPAATRTALAARYRWWRGSGAGWRHLPDLSVAFLERALEMSAADGTLAMLLPAKLATVGYAATCRAALAHGTTLAVVADLSDDPRAGFEATTYPMALIATRGIPRRDHEVRRGLDVAAPGVPQRLWRERGCWTLAPADALAIAERLGQAHPVLSGSFKAALGVKTGANRVFLDPPPALRQWTRPVIRGRDVTRPSTSRSRMLWPADRDGEPMAVLPEPLAAYLAPHRTTLARRRDCTAGPYWRLFRTATATARWRVIWPDIARALHPVALTEPEPVPLNSCYVIATRTRDEAIALGGWLASGPIRALAALDAEPASGGFRRFGARTVGAIPLPHGVLREERLRELSRAGPSRALDRWVSARFGLDAAEEAALDALGPAGR